MSEGPGRPTRIQWQNPKYSGYARGWFGCTPHATAMAGDEGSVNRVVLTGKQIHAETGDTSGGTTLNQCVPSLRRRGIKVDIYVGSEVVAPYWLAVQLQAGRCVIAQGSTKAFLGTIFRSTGTGVNHAITLADARGGTLGDPDEILVYDPAADGRKAGWGTAAKGPQWMPWGTVKAFFAALKPNGEDSVGTLGPGKVYCAVLPDTEPHAHLRYNATNSSPLPDRTRVNVASVWLRTSPEFGSANHVKRLYRDTLFVAYQKVTRGGVLWLGNHEGTRWVLASKMRNVGGDQ